MNAFNWKRLNTKEYINLSVTLFSGQVFHFKKFKKNIYKGVLKDTLITLKQENRNIYFLDDSSLIEEILINFFNLNVEINLNIIEKKGLRFLTNDLNSTIFSFICSANNNINRITKMVNYLYSKGNLLTIHSNLNIDENTNLDDKFFTFPSLDLLVDIEDELKLQKFGYRASYICNTAKFLLNNKIDWNQLTYIQAKNKLMKLKGIGNKVADCICLISLKHFQAVPIDTHIFKYSIKYFNLNFNKLTNLNYNFIQSLWIEKYGNHAGIAQLYVFKEYLDKNNNL